LAESLLEKYPDKKVFLVTEKRSEGKLMDFPGDSLSLNLPPRNRVGNLRFLWRLFKACLKVKSHLKGIPVKGVVVTGGYACLPSLLWALWQGKKIWILEQNQIPGRVTRFFSFWAENIHGPVGTKQRKIRATGVPVRRVIRSLSKKKKFGGPLNILVCGGSQASNILDTRLPPLLNRLAKTRQLRIFHVHRPGATLAYEPPLEWQGREPSTDFPEWLEKADVIISRAGGSSIAESNALGLAQVLIPYKASKDDHQKHNALFQVSRGAAVLMEEGEGDIIWEEKLVEALEEEFVKKRQQAAKVLDAPGACGQILADLFEG
jgi:UDP-N-acetylglucosamine--N-acetylmuramyl-(pentapeptide) pyrophosphoryl-undecaprenol N-acetylglucosamine transferase